MMKEKKSKYKRRISNIAFIIAGIFLEAFALKGFILPNHFLEGGMTGVSILLNIATKVPLWFYIFVVNIPFVFLAWKQLGRRTARNSIFAITGLSLVLAFMDFPIITDDKLLSAIFGGLFLGLGTGLAIKGNGTLDGTEILALFISKKTNFTVGRVIALLNMILFTSAIFIVGIENSMYSILTYYAASKSIDYFLYGIEELYAVTIVSENYQIIKKEIQNRLKRGVTLLDGEGGYSKNKIQLIYCVITILEVSKLKNIIEINDSKAFVTYHSLKEAHGGLTKKKFSFKI